jgi:hypothetical protein
VPSYDNAYDKVESFLRALRFPPCTGKLAGWVRINTDKYREVKSKLLKNKTETNIVSIFSKVRGERKGVISLTRYGIVERYKHGAFAHF